MALTRGQSLYTFELFPDDIVALNSRALAGRGVKVLTVYDALNDNRNIVSSVRSAHEAGMQVNAMMTYTLSPVHSDGYYVERAGELRALNVDFIAIKDPTGLLTPERGRTLFPAVVKAAGAIPLQLHSHCQSGLAPEVYEVAMQSGFSLGHTATRPLANGASLPATEDVYARARRLGCDAALDCGALAEVAGYFDWLCEREGKPRGEVARYDPALYEHQIPGGMVSNLRYQLETMQLAHRLPEILEEVAQVRRDLGYPIVVSPFAQYIVTQATLNVVQGERYKTIPDEVRKYALGYYGRLAATPADVFLERANIRPEELRHRSAGRALAARGGAAARRVRRDGGRRGCSARGILRPQAGRGAARPAARMQVSHHPARGARRLSGGAPGYRLRPRSLCRRRDDALGLKRAPRCGNDDHPRRRA